MKRSDSCGAAMISIVMWLTVAIWLSGCASGEESTPDMGMRIERVASKGFRVIWTTAAPVKMIVFTRPNQFRKATWQVETADLKFDVMAGYEILSSMKETREFRVFIPDDSLAVGTDYPLLTTYADHSVILYTGHLQANMVRCFKLCRDVDVATYAAKAGQTRLELVPAPEERVILDADPAPIGETRSVSVGPNGTMVYFGRQSPVLTHGFVIVPDSEMPAWLVPELEEMFPEILSLNERRLKFRINAKPTIFLLYHPGGRKHSSAHSGSVVGNQMILALFGSRWSRRTTDTREDFLKLLAHESFHLWNATLFHSVDQVGGRWLHEGSADAFAYRALLELGVVSSRRFAGLQSEALNRCLLGMVGTDLVKSDDQSWSVRNHYECGAVIQNLIDVDLQNRKGSDLWTFWSKLFQSSVDGVYTHDLFFELISNELGPESALASSIRSLTSGSIGGSDENSQALEVFFTNTFATVGSALEPSDAKWPTWYHRLLSERVLSAALESDCGGEGYFVEIGSETIRLIGGSWCRNLKEEREIDRIARYSAIKEGVQAYDFVRRACRSGERKDVSLTRAKVRGELLLLCPTLPKRPRFYSLPNSDF